jgi:hypothetical protein
MRSARWRLMGWTAGTRSTAEDAGKRRFTALELSQKSNR